MSGFVPVPRAALEAIEVRDWHAVVDLYRRAHALHWSTFRFSQRALMTRWGMDNRRVWEVINRLEAMDLVSVVRGGFRRPSTITIACPTKEADVHQQRHQQCHHNSLGSSEVTAESVSLVAPQGAPILTRGETETRDRDFPPNPRKRGDVNAEWVAEVFQLEIESSSDPAGAAGRAIRADRQLVDRVAEMVKGKTPEARGRWSGAPEGLRRKEIADGLRIAGNRWTDQAAPELRYPLRQVP